MLFFSVIFKLQDTNKKNFFTVLRIRNVYIGSRIRIKEFKYFNPKKWFLSSRKYDPGCSSRIRMLTFYPSRIPGSKRHRIPDPRSGSATLSFYAYFFLKVHLHNFSKINNQKEVRIREPKNIRIRRIWYTVIILQMSMFKRSTLYNFQNQHA